MPTDTDDSRKAKLKRGLKAAGQSLQRDGQSALDSVRQQAGDAASKMDSYRKGGKVRKTGLARLHGGERVIKRLKAKRAAKIMKRGKGRKSSGRN